MKNWNKYFINIAKMVANDNSSCLKHKVGCILVRQDNTIISTGYNGAVIGQVSCGERNTCYRIVNNIKSGEHYEKCYAIHAEQNAILFAAKHGLTIKNAKCYITHKPCYVCLKMLYQTGILEIYYVYDYPNNFKGYLDIEKYIKLTKI